MLGIGSSASRRTLVLAAATACMTCKDPATAKVNRNVDTLEKLMVLPVRPREVWFASLPRGIQSWVPGPVDYSLLVVMRFDPSELSAWLSRAKLVERKPATLEKRDALPWLPPEVRAALTPDDERHYLVKGREFSADAFAPRSIATTDAGSIGTFIVVQDGPFVVLRRDM